MSGGSWDYVYSQVEDAADRLLNERQAERRAFGNLLRLCSEALHDIEWVDSGDCSPGDELKAINRALNYAGDPLAHLVDDAEELIKKLETYTAGNRHEL